MIIVSWNINSVRLRIGLLQELIVKHNPDIICLQETKVVDELFPKQDILDLGYNYLKIKGQKSYNGVAILSKIEFKDDFSLKLADIDDARHISITLPQNIELHNFYIPAGGDEPDPVVNPKFAHKLAVVDYMDNWFRLNRKPQDKIIILGDFNIAPLEHDVWSHKQLLKVVSHTPIEVEKLNKLKSSLNWLDTARHFVPEKEKLYSWWSYRNKDWKKSNRGRRLDHIWVTRSLEANLVRQEIMKDMRDQASPSDHVPVIIELNLD